MLNLVRSRLLNPLLKRKPVLNLHQQKSEQGALKCSNHGCFRALKCMPAQKLLFFLYCMVCQHTEAWLASTDISSFSKALLEYFKALNLTLLDHFRALKPTLNEHFRALFEHFRTLK